MVDVARPIIDIQGLRTVLSIHGVEIAALVDVSFSIAPGRTLALVGESGSGKSMTSLSIMRLLPGRRGRIAAGTIQFRGKDGIVHDLATLGGDELRHIRGNHIGMIFQEPMTSLNPVYTIGDQIAEPIRIHRGATRRSAMDDAVRLLAAVGISDPSRAVRRYPHEFSGGMRQRATIAMALACDPTLLIADEPTTALDVTIQAEILDLLRGLQAERGMGILFVTHSLGVVAEIAQDVAVMYAGRVVEQGPVRAVFNHPRHPYTIGLLASVPKLGEATQLKRAGRSLTSIPGVVPSLTAMPRGCAFAARCSYALDACRVAEPPQFDVGKGHATRCIRWQEL
jgi:peptide/nickel transport system ATP-binding protein